MSTKAIRVVSVVGFFILAGITLLLFVLGFFESVKAHHVAAVPIMAVILLGLTYETVQSWRKDIILGPQACYYEQKDLGDFLSVFGGTLVTFYISVHMGLGAVVASGLVGILGAAFLKPYAAAIFCGSFAGMASATVFPTWPCIMLAGAIAGLVFVAGKYVLIGFGGKLGTTAFLGCIAASLIIGQPLLQSPVPGWDVGWLIVLYSIAAAVITFVLSVRFGHGAVMASGIVGLTGGLLLPVIHGSALGGTLAVMVFCASFAGMCATDRLDKEHWYAIAGLFAALVFIYSSPHLGGAGGKLGTIAFGSVIALRGLIDMVGRLREWGKNPVAARSPRTE